MQQHPVPQQISSYEFRLVGDMTLKQFGQVAGGIIVGLLFYASHLHPLVKWPLVIIPIVLGLAMAFFPIEERPIQTWIIAFFKAVYSPTQYIWQKKGQVPEVLTEEKKKPAKTPVGVPKSPKEEQKLATYLVSLPKTKAQTVVEAEEEKFLDKVQKLFSTLTPSPSIKTNISARKKFPEKEIGEEEKKKSKTSDTKKVHPPLVTEIEGQKPFEKKEEEKPLERETEKEELLQKLAPSYIPLYTPPVRKPKKQIPAREAEFGEIPMPSTPTVPNLIVGMVTDKEGKIIEGAILEIRDEKGIPVRALRTNKLGQFQIATPLSNGNYEIEVEKEGYEFDLYKLRLDGKILEPIKIQAKNKSASHES